MRNSYLAGLLILLGTSGGVLLGQQQPDLEAAGRLRSIGQAMHMYATENKGYLPANIGMLAGVIPKEMAERAQRDFVYLPPPGSLIRKVGATPQTPWVMTKPELDKPLIVLFGDVHVQAYVPAPPESAVPPFASTATGPSTPATAPAAWMGPEAECP